MRSTVASASAIISCFAAGTVISEIDTVIAASVEYLYPIALIASSVSAVVVAPWILIHFSRIFFNCFLPTWKSISSASIFSSLLRSTKPKSCGIISLKSKRPRVVSRIFSIGAPAAFAPHRFTLIFWCRVIAPFICASSAVLVSS